MALNEAWAILKNPFLDNYTPRTVSDPFHSLNFDLQCQYPGCTRPALRMPANEHDRTLCQEHLDEMNTPMEQEEYVEDPLDGEGNYKEGHPRYE